jgi:chromosome transmission fidelity protein 18
MAYTPYAIVPWFSHFASPANVERPVDFPKTDYEVSNFRLPRLQKHTSMLTPDLLSLMSSLRRTKTSEQLF